MPEGRVVCRLAAIFAAEIAGYSPPIAGGNAAAPLARHGECRIGIGLGDIAINGRERKRRPLSPDRVR